jgi:hypothetical protein
MKRKMLLFVAIVITVAAVNLALSKTGYADPAAAPAANQATVDVTINDAGQVSVGGIDLAALGIAPLDPSVLTYAKDLNSVNVNVAGDAVSLDLQGTPLATIQWTPAERQAVTTLAARYGVQLNPDTQGRIEEWISSSNVDVTARFANEPSKPLSLALSKYLWLDIGSNGQLMFEKSPLAAYIDPSVIQSIEIAGNQANVCWDKGTLNSMVDGQALPSITLNKDGVQLLSKSLNLGIDNYLDQIAGAKFGVDVALPGGAHSASATCGQ